MKNICLKLLGRLSLGVAVLSSGSETFALPVLNENVSSGTLVVVYPDSDDPHRFYVAPNVVDISLDEQKVPMFSYVETKNGLFSEIIGIMQMTLSPRLSQRDLDQSKERVLAKNPQAVFVALPFVRSELVLTGNLHQLIRDNQCEHKAGLLGQAQSCALVLTKQGRKLWYNAFDNKKLFTTLQFEYSVQGVVRLADGSLQDQMLSMGIATVIHGKQLADFPDLIKRRR